MRKYEGPKMAVHVLEGHLLNLFRTTTPTGPSDNDQYTEHYPTFSESLQRAHLEQRRTRPIFAAPSPSRESGLHDVPTHCAGVWPVFSGNFRVPKMRSLDHFDSLSRDL